VRRQPGPRRTSLNDHERETNTMTGSKTATVETLTAEVRVLMVGSRQVTMSVYNQLDEVDYDDIHPFGRVRPKGDDSYIWLVGRHEASGTLVRARIPASHKAVAREAGFSSFEHNQLCCGADEADKAAAKYESKGNATLYIGNGHSGTGTELATQNRERAKRLRETARAMHDKFLLDARPYWLRVEEAEDLPLIVLAGLR